MSAAAHRPDNRVFHYAVLASIVLHGLLFTFTTRDASRGAAAAPAPIVARLVEPPPASAPPKPEEPPAPRVEEPKRPVVKPAPSPKTPPVAKSAPKPPPEPAPEAAPAAPTPSAEPAPAVSAAPSAAPAVSAAPPPADAIHADDLARFRMQVIEAAMRFKRYPRTAQENNWVGRVDVRVTFGADGRRASIVVVRSSGHEILDKQALDTITKAFVPVPPALRGRAFALEIPVIYSLNDSPSG